MTDTDVLESGIPGLDEILCGGMQRRRSYLLVGPAGSGKTLLSLQWLLAGAAAGEAGLYVTLAEPAGELRRDVKALGWDLDRIAIADLSPSTTEWQVPDGEYHVFAPTEVENLPLWQSIYQAVQEQRPTRLVLDSVSQLYFLSTDDYQFRRNLLGLLSYLSRIGCSSILIFEPATLERESAVALAVDAVIRLTVEMSRGRAITLRHLEVQKLRGSDFLSGVHPLRISKRGVTIFPHRIEETGRSAYEIGYLTSGIPALDQLLGGGLELGTTSLLRGPSGVGKSTLGVQFLVRAAERVKCVVYTFEESVDSMERRCREIGIPIRERLQSGMLRIVPVNPMQLYPDEFLATVRRDVEEGHTRVVMLDSMRGYELAMDEFGSSPAHLHNLLAYLNGKGVSTILVLEEPGITAPTGTGETAASHLTDNLILMRYAELGARIVKIIGCLKKRLGNFEPELRELRITATGMTVGEPLSHLHAVLSGLPTTVAEARRRDDPACP